MRRMQDVPLSGGNTNAPVRRGDAVHRIAGAWTPTIHRLLEHVAARGIHWLPRPLGVDEQGREVLTFLPGTVPAYPMPPAVWTHALLLESAHLLRAFHDATADFPRDGAVWQQPDREPAEVICHNDFVPYNFVLEEGRIVGVIDVDMASPGPRARDLAHLAYRIVPLAAPGNPDLPTSPLDERRQRLAALVAAYDGPTVEEVLSWLRPLLDDAAAFAEGRGGRFLEHARGYRADAAWVVWNRAALSS
jgi:hypothetical protein